MSFNFNILVSTPRNFERDALAELDFLIHQVFPDNQFNYGNTIVSGLVWGNIVNHEPIQAVNMIRNFVIDKHFPLHYLLKFVPIETVMKTDFDEIEKYILNRLQEIDESESFKIVVNKRRISLEKLDIIKTLAKNIQRTVDLENPVKIIHLETIGKYTGISFLKKNDIYNAINEKID